QPLTSMPSSSRTNQKRASPTSQTTIFMIRRRLGGRTAIMGSAAASVTELAILTYQAAGRITDMRRRPAGPSDSASATGLDRIQSLLDPVQQLGGLSPFAAPLIAFQLLLFLLLGGDEVRRDDRDQERDEGHADHDHDTGDDAAPAGVGDD